MENEIQAITVANVSNANVGAMVTSFKADPANRETSVKIFNALNNPAERIANHINETIEIENYLIEMTEIEDTDASGNGLGTFSKVPRVVVVAPDGTSYQAVSFGIANAVRNIVAVCGDAPWSPAIQLKIKQISTKKGSMLTVDMVG